MRKKKQDYAPYVAIIIIVAIVAAVLIFANKSNLAGEASRSQASKLQLPQKTCLSQLDQANTKIAKLEAELLTCRGCDQLTCGSNVEVNDVFNLGECTQFQYRSADAMTKTSPKIKFKNIETSETLENTLELRLLTSFSYEGIKYHFWSDSDYKVDNFVINLVTPCDNDGVACLAEIHQNEEFVLGGDRFKYTSADKATKTNPKLVFKNLETGNSFEMALKLAALSHISLEGTRYHFESTSGTNCNQDDFTISLFSECN